jgi:hypothetical protein
MMGGPASDLTSPEFNGGTFTQTFIYGFHLGQEIFLEPMVTQAYLEGLAGASTFAIRQPSQYGLSSLPSLIPTSYQIAHNSTDDLYTIRVADFVTPAAVPEASSLFLLAIGIAATVWLASRQAVRHTTARNSSAAFRTGSAARWIHHFGA